MTSPEGSAHPHSVPDPASAVADGSFSAAGTISPREAGSARLDRRSLLIGGGAAAVAFLGLPLLQRFFKSGRTSVFLAAGQAYTGRLTTTIRDGLLAVGFQPETIRGRRVLLKPNMVEPSRTAPHMTTHPLMIRACAEVFRAWGAEVKVGEAPGHVRDTEMALFESGIGAALRDDRLPFADLNYEDVGWTKNRGGTSPLAGFHFPRSVLEADLVVSMPKLKTHHWVGLTAALKNMYGVIPGIKYGWPKNVLHHAGIPQTVVDINASIPPTIGIIDGIVCMEGDGPIMGSPKELGLVAIGANLPALDATCARIMALEPTRVSYLKLAAGRLGTIEESTIEQRGDGWRPLVTPFEILDAPHLRPLRAAPGVLTS